MKYLFPIFSAVFIIATCTNKSQIVSQQPSSKEINDPKFVLSGKRDYNNLIKTVIDSSYMRNLRTKYLEILNKTPGLKGKVYTELEIIQNGSVISSKITRSTMNQPDLENYIKEYSLSWKFNVLNIEDTTKVVFPFVFSQ